MKRKKAQIIITITIILALAAAGCGSTNTSNDSNLVNLNSDTQNIENEHATDSQESNEAVTEEQDSLSDDVNTDNSISTDNSAPGTADDNGEENISSDNNSGSAQGQTDQPSGQNSTGDIMEMGGYADISFEGLNMELLQPKTDDYVVMKRDWLFLGPYDITYTCYYIGSFNPIGNVIWGMSCAVFASEEDATATYNEYKDSVVPGMFSYDTDVVLEQEGNVLYFGARTNYDYTSKWQYYAVYDEYGYAYTEGANWVDSDKTWFSKPLLQEDKAKAAEFTTVAAGFAGNYTGADVTAEKLYAGFDGELRVTLNVYESFNYGYEYYAFNFYSDRQFSDFYDAFLVGEDIVLVYYGTIIYEKDEVYDYDKQVDQYDSYYAVKLSKTDDGVKVMVQSSPDVITEDNFQALTSEVKEYDTTLDSY